MLKSFLYAVLKIYEKTLEEYEVDRAEVEVW